MTNSRFYHYWLTPYKMFYFRWSYDLREWGIGVIAAIGEGIGLTLQIGPIELSTGVDTSSPF